MTEGHQFSGESAAMAPDTVTVLDGATFALSFTSGDIDTSAPLGFFHQDTRLVSRWLLSIDDQPFQPLAHLLEEPFRCRFVGQAMVGSSRLLVERERYIGHGMREDIVLSNLSTEELSTTVRLEVGADFADLFAVKESRVSSHQQSRAQVEDGWLTLTAAGRDHPGRPVGVRVKAEGATVKKDGVSFSVNLDARGEWRGRVYALPMIDGKLVPTMFPAERAVSRTGPGRQLERWREKASRFDCSDEAVEAVLARSREDIGGLRIFDGKQAPVVAAGSPWFMTLFGRDSLLTSYQALSLDPSLAIGVLERLARYQGDQVVKDTEEQPGRILHEVRFDPDQTLQLGGKRIYYGTIDATPLFVALLGECARWHGATSRIQALLPAADKALAWIDDYGDRDGDGFVEYQRMTSNGLANQGWKDSWNGITFADGTIAEAPIALCEVQGYVYAAFRARAALAELFDDPAGGQHWRRRADELKRAFNEQFWLADRGWFALGLDKDKRKIDALASNMGQALAFGIVDDSLAAQVARHLVAPPLFSGWGVRTLATTMGAYDPLSYHNGSVWPHDNAIIAYGLMRAGFVPQAQQIAQGILTVADKVGGRLPELFCGLERSRYPEPVPYPTACSPQAWAAAAPVHLARALLGLEPSLPERQVRVRPRLLPGMTSLAVRGLSLAGGTVDVHAADEHTSVTGLPEGIDGVTGD